MSRRDEKRSRKYKLVYALTNTAKIVQRLKNIPKMLQLLIFSKYSLLFPQKYGNPRKLGLLIWSVDHQVATEEKSDINGKKIIYIAGQFINIFHEIWKNKLYLEIENIIMALSSKCYLSFYFDWGRCTLKIHNFLIPY